MVRLLLLALVASAHALLLGGQAPPLSGAAARAPVAAMMAKKSAGKKLVSVLLDADVPGTGAKGVVVQVKASYAENVIVRGGLGKVATQAELEQIAAAEAEAAAAAAEQKQKAEAAKGKIQERYDAASMAFEVQPDDVITSANVAAELLRTTKVAVSADDITMPEISEIPGSCIAELRLHPKVKATVKVNVEKSKITFS